MQTPQHNPDESFIVERILSPDEVRAAKLRDLERKEQERIRTLSGRVKQIIEKDGIIEKTFENQERV